MVADQRAVTAVMGSIMVLGITVGGIVAALVWGTPLVQRTQDRNQLDAMIAEFEDLRQNSLVLTVPDASRTPNVALSGGTLAIGGGDLIMITINMDATSVDCDFHVTDWADLDHIVTIDSTGCKAPTTGGGCDPCLNAYTVAGGATSQMQTALAGATLTITTDGTTPAPLAGSDWVIRIESAAGDRYAEAWIFRLGQLAWTQQSSESDLAVHLQGGAVFSRQDDAIFLQRNPPIQEDAYATGDYLLRLPTLATGNEVSVTGSRSYQVYMGLINNYARVATDDAYTLRYDISGDLSEGWCNTLLLRNDLLVGDPYSVQTACSADVPSVRYRLVDPPSGNPGTAAFTFEFIHASLLATLSI